MDTVLGCADLFECMVRWLDPRSAVALNRTCSASHTSMRAAFLNSPSLLATVAHNTAGKAMTKTSMMGWFALTSPEASAIKHAVYVRNGGGFYYLYSGDAFEQAVAVVGKDRAERVARRCTWSATRIHPYPRVDAAMRLNACHYQATTAKRRNRSYTANTRSNAASKGSILSARMCAGIPLHVVFV